MRPTLLLLALPACTKGSLDISPAQLFWGEVDFQNDENQDCTPEGGGCAADTVELINVGEADLSLSLPQGYPSEYLCVEGFPADSPMDLGTLSPGSSYDLRVAVCGYVPGELDSEVTGTLVVENDGAEPQVSFEWSFPPVRDFGADDSGL